MAAEATLEEIINDARDFASTSYDEATDLISRAQSAANTSISLTPRSLNFSAPDAEDFDLTDDPGEFADGYTPPITRPDSPGLLALHIPELPEFPEAPGALDTSGLFQFDRPVFDLAGFTKTAPEVNTDIDFPEAPDIQEYAAPDTTPLSLRDTPSITVPTFNPDVVVNDPGAVPDIAEAYKQRLAEVVPALRDWVETYADAWIDRYAPQYHTALATLEAKIAEGYEGNTALPDSVEQQIFDRGVSRAEAERANLDAEAADRFARRGYRLPPVALAAQLGRNQEAVARNAADVAREVAIRRAEIEHQHVQFVMQLSTGIRDAMRSQVLQYAGLLVSINGQALQDSQQLASIMATVYQLLTDRARLDMDHLRTLAQIFETQMKAALADIEIFKVEMEAAKLRKDAELSDVEVWSKKIDAQNTRINLYLAQLRAITEQVGIERLRVDIFGSEVSAYTALTNAKEAEFGAYRSAIAGDEAIVQAQTEKVRAYSAEVDAARTKVQAEAALTDVGVQYNRNLIDVFRAELEAFGRDLDAEGRRFDSSADTYKYRLERFRQLLDAQLNEQRNRYDSSRLDLDARRAQTEADVRTLLSQAELLAERVRLIANTASSGAEAHAAMASSAVSAQNTMVNLVNETVN